ncbi:MAG TPA: N-acyl homoserine lactonase family protein [Longimicrobiales bacterium]
MKRTRSMRAAAFSSAAACALIVLGACAASSQSGSGAGQTVTALHALDCGDITTSDRSQFSPGVGVGQRLDLTNTCYVVRHPRGVLVWDTGLPDALAASPDGMRGQQYHVRRKQTLTDQLTRLGLTPDAINYLAISHLHFDHSGNANYFTKATWLIQKPEYEAAFSARAPQMGFELGSYDKLKSNPVQQLTGDHDVFGDSSVVILSTPGHTIGHQSLLVRLPSGNKVLLSGDLWHFRGNRQIRGVPAFNFDKAQTLASMDRVEALLKAHNARLIIQHDPEDVAALGPLPATVR